MKSIEDKLLGQLYCFCGGGDDSGGGGSAGDFDDSYNQAMGYTDTLGGVGRSDEDGNARQTTDEERAAAPGYESKVEQAAKAAAGGGDYTDVFKGDAAAYNDLQRSLAGNFLGYGGGDLGPSVGDKTGPYDTTGPYDQTTPVQDAPRDMGQVSRAEMLSGPRFDNQITREEQLRGPRPSDQGLSVEDIDIFDTAYTGGATPASQVTKAAGVQAARSVGSPEDAVTDFDGVTLSKGPGVPKDTFVQDTTPRTKEEKQMAEDRGYFNYQDLNKDGTVTDLERVLSAQAFGLVGKLSDLERKMNIGPTKADGTAAIPGRDFEYQRTASGAIDPNDPNYMGQDSLDYEGGGSGFGAYETPDSIFSMEGDTSRGEGPAVVAPVVQQPVECPDGYKYNEETKSCEYVGQSLVGGVASTSAPITATTQYTGVAGLQPFVLQPSYTAPTSFSPTYNIG